MATPPLRDRAAHRPTRRQGADEWRLTLSCSEILACPEDKGPLLYFEDEATLYNPRLRRRYRILDGIPVLLVEEAETVTEDEHARLEAKAAADGRKAELRFGCCARPPAALRLVGRRLSGRGQRGVAAPSGLVGRGHRESPAR